MATYSKYSFMPNSLAQHNNWRFFHVALCINSSFFFITWRCPIIGVEHNFFISLPVGRHLHCFWIVSVGDKDTVNIHVQVLYVYLLLFLLGRCLGVNLLHCITILCLTLEEMFKPLFKAFIPFCIPTSSIQEFQLSHILSNL